jgi:hypothetical protein
MTSFRHAVLATVTGCAVLVSLAAASVPAAAVSAAATGQNELSVTISWRPGVQESWTLRCDPVGGTHPNRARACAFLESLTDPFARKPTGMACTMIYSGPEQAQVVGRWHGRPVRTAFARNDGCATARWHQYRSLLSDPGTISLSGRVDLGPTCPVQRPDESCTTTGAAATVTATSGSRHRSTPAGVTGFLLRLPRGVWVVTANAWMYCQKVRVDTRARPVPGPIVITCDTGIRASA